MMALPVEGSFPVAVPDQLSWQSLCGNQYIWLLFFAVGGRFNSNVRFIPQLLIGPLMNKWFSCFFETRLMLRAGQPLDMCGIVHIHITSLPQVMAC